jgi:hypothetical protein
MTLMALNMFVPLALAGVIFLGIVVGYYSKRGNDISKRPSDGLGGDSENAAPGAAGESRIAGRTDGDQDRLDTHGTR